MTTENWASAFTPEQFVEAAKLADVAQKTLEQFWDRFNFDGLGLSDEEHGECRERAKTEGATPAEIVEYFGICTLLRERLKEAGWQPPQCITF